MLCKIFRLLLIGAAVLSAQDAREIVRRSVSTDLRNRELARNYTFLQRNQETRLNSSGQAQESKSRTYEVLILHGRPYRRLIELDDRPLPEADARKEQKKLDEALAERAGESPEHKRRRLEKEAKEREKHRKMLAEVPDAFDFRLLGEQRIDGRDTYAIEASPRAGYRPKESDARILTKFRGRLWVDKSEYQWVKADLEAIDSLSFGLFLARVHPGMRLIFEQTRVHDELWLPHRFFAKAEGRLALIKKLHSEYEVLYRDYRKFQADSRVVSTSEIE